MDNSKIQQQEKMLVEAESKGMASSFSAYFKLSGPGWLQSAITLGGGSLAGALFLGIIGGYSLLWLQVVAIVLGVIMLSAISYVSLSSKEKPFPAINKHISPLLGWGWAIATLMANMVWCLPQFALSTAAVQQNLIPSLQGNYGSKFIIAPILLAIAVFVIWFYDKGGKGKQIFDGILKSMVALIVLAFLGVVIKLAASSDSFSFAEILKGYIPNFSAFSNPAATFAPFLNSVASDFQGFWTNEIVSMQKNVMIGAASAAVGINMTFLLPYSMLARGWNRNFRKMGIFDLSFGMMIPFLLVTSCVVIASATQFHAKPDQSLISNSPDASKKLVGTYNKFLKKRVQAEAKLAGVTLTAEEASQKASELPMADKNMASMLVKRDAFSLAKSLAPLMGDTWASYIFGFGVLGMGLSTIIVLMLISGFVICEIFNLPQDGPARRWGSMLPAVGILGPFIWGKAVWLAIATSVIGIIVLPVAYFTFLIMMNSKKILGDDVPKGSSKLIWNSLMGIACGLASIAALWAVHSKFEGLLMKLGFGPGLGNVGILVLGLYVIAVIISHLMIRKRAEES